MAKRRQLYLGVLSLLLFLLVLIFSLNFYLVNWLAAHERPRHDLDREPIQSVTASSLAAPLAYYEKDPQHGLLQLVENKHPKTARAVSIHAAVEAKVAKLKPVFKNKNPRYVPVKRGLRRSFEARNYNISSVWRIANSWPSRNEIFPQKDERIGKTIKALQEADVLKTRNTPRGTQLKLIFELAGGQLAIFKPSWYERNTTIDGQVYSGKDRHNSEIVAFHLAAVLNLRWTPIVVGRRISLVEVYRLADDELQSTMIKNDTRQCVYGKCHYCKESETICDHPETGMVEGALLLLIPGKFAKYRSPWQRTYQTGAAAEWEKNDSYCVKVKEQLPLVRILDLIDVAVFDFLIQNGDRHHYETRDDRVLLMDNGKGFGNPYTDHFDILAPLYQCCM
ncbi:glycosaminoglycan xylosylkinase homolog isoform X2 [Toxorhynchites rutilus septentrionalis]|nr:glycosaminoglycan xylosylkinase homolog isoform X2 [Toxorhynchites rutilus septentrionalis]